MRLFALLWQVRHRGARAHIKGMLLKIDYRVVALKALPGQRMRRADQWGSALETQLQRRAEHVVIMSCMLFGRLREPVLRFCQLEPE